MSDHPFNDEKQQTLLKASTNLLDLAGVRQNAYSLSDDIQVLCDTCFAVANHQGWWTNPKTGEPLSGEFAPGQREHPINVPAKLMLISCELSEAYAAMRDDAQDEHLSNYDGAAVELADTVIRIADLAGGLGLRLAKASRVSNYGQAVYIEHLDNALAEEPSERERLPLVLLLEAQGCVATAMEGFRKGTIFSGGYGDVELESFTLLEVALCDTLLKCFSMARLMDLPIDTAINDKLLYNLQREDHKLANRAAEGGKSV